jgi:hypothetical protein
VNVVIEKIANYRMIGFAQNLDWINSAVGTADMQQNFHEISLF